MERYKEFLTSSICFSEKNASYNQMGLSIVLFFSNFSVILDML
jgi:hypothetical protein